MFLNVEKEPLILEELLYTLCNWKNNIRRRLFESYREYLFNRKGIIYVNLKIVIYVALKY